MFCINCGVKLADSEKICPLCNTVVYHPDLQREPSRPLYPTGKTPKVKAKSKAFNGAVIILFLIPILVSFLCDLQTDRELNWFGFVALGLVLGYIAFALPLWFKNPNPVIFVPCDFVAATAYLFYINLVTGGDWFLSFAFPVSGGCFIIVCTVVTLLRYLKKGKLYIFGGMFVAFAGLILLIEFLLDITFGLSFIGWSVYPFIVLTLFGGMLIYLAINNTAREMMERKLFF